MAIDYGTPPMAVQSRKTVAERLKEVGNAAGVSETLTIEWRGQPLSVEVIYMPVRDLLYNPDTHRIRAQRSHNADLDQMLGKDPWSGQGQEYLESLLKALPRDPALRDPEFDVLLKSLRDFKQSDPGLITRDGVLVNGNTRRAALKELGVAEMRVGVLPESCTWDDVSAVELALQLRKEHRRDYSYINELLAIEEQVMAGRSLEQIARAFHIRVSTCQENRWILSCLQDLILRSATADGKRLRLMDFEDAKEKLRELHRRYEKEAAVNKDNADLLREFRLAAVALNFSKTDIRVVQPDFQTRYLDRLLPDSLRLKIESPPAAVAIPGLNRTMRASGAKMASARGLTDVILKAQASANIGGPVSASEATESINILKNARQAFDQAIDSAKMDERVRKRGLAAPDRINEACKDLEQCITDLAVARGSNSLDEEAYDEAVLSLRSTLRKLAVESARSIKAPGDGVSWLLDAVSEDAL